VDVRQQLVEVAHVRATGDDPAESSTRPTRKSGGAKYVATVYCAHRDAAVFASRKSGSEPTEAI